MNKNKGITLIALIITIIIMLILVAVTISILINSGIIGKAQKAKQDTQSAYAQEQRIDKDMSVDGTVYNSFDEYVESLLNDKITLRYEYGYLWADIDESIKKDVSSLSNDEVDIVLDNYINLEIELMLQSGELLQEDFETELERVRTQLQSLTAEQKNLIAQAVVNDIVFTVDPEGEEEYGWSHKYNRMFIKEPGIYTATYYDLTTNPYKKYQNTINLNNLEEYTIKIGKDGSFSVVTQHFENSEYVAVTADRVVIKLNNNVIFDGTPPQPSGVIEFYKLDGVEDNTEYMADITAYFGNKQARFVGKITVRFPT